MLQSSTIKFLKDIKKNNNKPWFDGHRNAYDDAKADYAAFIQTILGKHAKTDPSLSPIVAKDCLFRINRDIRFSKDKTPYKTNFGASTSKGGKKSEGAGYYFHLEPGGSFAGGGIWMPTPEELKKIRQEVDYNLTEFKSIINHKRFKSIYGTLDQSKEYVLTRVPKGYEADNPAAEYLKMKSFVATSYIADADLTSSQLVKKTVTAFEALYPLLQFLDKAVGG